MFLHLNWRPRAVNIIIWKAVYISSHSWWYQCKGCSRLCKIREIWLFAKLKCWEHLQEVQGRGDLGSERVCNSLKNPTTTSKNFLKTQHMETPIWERQKHFCCSDRAKWPLSFVNGIMEQPELTRAGEKVETWSRNQLLLSSRNSGFSSVLTHLTKSHRAMSEGYLAKDVPTDQCSALLLYLWGPSRWLLPPGTDNWLNDRPHRSTLPARFSLWWNSSRNTNSALFCESFSKKDKEINLN